MRVKAARRGSPPLRRDSFERAAQVLDVRPDEARMIEEGSQLLDARRAFADRLARAFDVFAVLPAAGVRTVGRGDEGERALDSVVAHLTECVCEKRVPVAVAPV